MLCASSGASRHEADQARAIRQWRRVNRLKCNVPPRGSFTNWSIRKGDVMNVEQRNELLQQMLETELGGVQVYETALTCALNSDLQEEWQKYLEQTKRHVEIVETLMETLGLAPQETPARQVVR